MDQTPDALTSINAEYARLVEERAKLLRETAEQNTLGRQIRITGALEKAIRESGIDFNRADDIVTLASSHLDVEPSGEVVVLRGGTRRLNRDLKPISVLEFVNEFAAERPYLVRPAKQATGNRTSAHDVEEIFGPKSSPQLAQRLNADNPAEYARLRRLAVTKGLLRG